MNTHRNFRLRDFLQLFFSMLLLCSCATTPEPSAIIPATEWPAEVTIDSGAGRGGWLIVTIELEGGAEVPCLVDTGASWTVFDKSLEPQLGKRLGTMTVSILGVKKKLGRHAAPKLHLGGTRLKTDKSIYATDLKDVSRIVDRPIMGILGMDCLKHYCIQMDFEAGKMRFLNPDDADTTRLGPAFPVAIKYLPFVHQSRLIEGGGTNWFLIDTGCNMDGFLSAPIFRWRGQKHSDMSMARTKAAPGGDVLQETAWFSQCVWNGNTYTNLVIGTGMDVDLIGLRFLARHLVTLNFPKRTMHLKQSSIGPLPGDSLAKIVSDAVSAPSEYLEGLKAKGQLPGWSKDDNGQLFCIYHLHGDLNGYAFVFRDKGGVSVRQYQVSRASKGSPWKLEKAWRTDQEDHTIEVYPVP